MKTYPSNQMDKTIERDAGCQAGHEKGRDSFRVNGLRVQNFKRRMEKVAIVGFRKAALKAGHCAASVLGVFRRSKLPILANVLEVSI